jgi:hypothetical protein
MEQTSQRRWQHAPTPAVPENICSNNRPFLCRTLYKSDFGNSITEDWVLTVLKDVIRLSDVFIVSLHRRLI